MGKKLKLPKVVGAAGCLVDDPLGRSSELSLEWEFERLEFGTGTHRARRWIVVMVLTRLAAFEQAMSKARAMFVLRKLFRPILLFRANRAAATRLQDALSTLSDQVPPAAATLQSIPLLSSLPPSFHADFRTHLERCMYTPGTIINHEGTLKDFFLITRGSVAILTRDTDMAFRTAEHLDATSPTPYFGQSAVFSGDSRELVKAPRSCGLCVLWKLRKDHFHKLLSACSEPDVRRFRQNLTTERAKVLHKYYSLTPCHLRNCGRNAVLREFSDAALWELLRVMEPRVYTSGDVIVRGGERPLGVYLIANGYVEAVRAQYHPGTPAVLPLCPCPPSARDRPPHAPLRRHSSSHTVLSMATPVERRIALHSSWTVVGEREALMATPALATLRCVQDVDCWFVPRRPFLDLMLSYPHLFLEAKLALAKAQPASQP